MRTHHPIIAELQTGYIITTHYIYVSDMARWEQRALPLSTQTIIRLKVKQAGKEDLRERTYGEIITKHITMGNARGGRERNATVE